MKKSQHSSEEEVLNALMIAVDEIEIYAKKAGYHKFEIPLGFFFARVLDNKATISKKGKNELELAIIRAAAFIIVSQIFFYLILSRENGKNGLHMKTLQTTNHLQSLFDRMVINSSYDSIYNARVVELLSKESIVALNRTVDILLPFKSHKFNSDILGKIFHSLIPFELRKFLAAYYTSNIASEFLSFLAIRNAKSKIMDPACGSGTLLVSAYRRIKELNETLSHSQILQNIYGIDVSVFAAQLAGVNLALQEPENPLSNSQIVIYDIFKLEMSRKNQETELKIPKIDILLGNPPFTRGDRLDSEYKDFLKAHLHRQGIFFNYNKKYLGLYSYFLLDSLRLLKKDGVLAYVLPLSLINSSTMKPVLKFILSKFNVHYIITSEAQIVFSEQCAFKEILFIAQKGKKIHSKTKFVVLKEELSRKNYRALAERVEKTTEDYEDSNLRIRHISRKYLESDLELNWNVFFFKQTFFSLLEQIRHLKMISPLDQIVKTPRYDIDRGLRAGISDFFYLPNKHWKIIDDSKNYLKIQKIDDKSILKLPRKYFSPILRKSSLYKRIVPEKSNYVVVIPDKDIKEEAVEEYVKWGIQKFQRNGFESLTYKHIEKGRKIARVGITHEISLRSSSIVAYFSPDPIILTDNFIFIRTFDEEKDKIIAAYLNSSVFLLTYFVLRREKTGALGQIFGTDIRNFFCLNPAKVTKTDRKELIQIFDRFAQESSHFPPFLYQIKYAKKDKNHIRFLLDKKVCEILELSDVSNFLRQLYETLIEELNKFN